MAQVSIGFGESSTSAPINPFFGYSYVQSIYLSSEINTSGEITALQYYTKPGTTLTNSKDWVVYMGHTSKEVFDDNQDWITVSADLQKFSGEIVHDTDTNIVTVTLDTPFTYNGTDNLFIATDENTDSYNGSLDDFYATEVGSNRTIYYINDSTNPDPLTPPATGSTVVELIANITFVGITPSCPYPTDLLVSDIDNDSAKVNWTTGGATEWHALILESSAAMPTADATGFEVISGTPEVTFSDLEEDTDYRVYVRDNCGSETSIWFPSSTFTTLLDCPAPTALEVSNIAETTAKISWTTGGASTWKVIVQEASLDAPTEDATDFTEVNDVAEFNAENLIEGTEYNVYVKDNCGADLGESVWVSTNFITNCGLFTINESTSYEYGFEADELKCWEYVNEGTGNNWEVFTSATYSSEGANSLRYRYNSSYPANAWAYTQGLVLEAGDVIELNFDYRTYSSFSEEKLKVTVGSAKTVEAQSTVIWDNNGGESLTNTTYSNARVIYTATEAGTYYLAFNCYSDANKFNLYVDNINVAIAPACLYTTDVVVSNVTNNSADVAWTTGGAEAWQVLVQEASLEAPAADATGFMDVADAATTTLTDLEEDTEYIVYVRDNCGEEQGAWEASESFTTLLNCPAPTELTISEITNNSLKIDWTTGGADAWHIIIQEASLDAPADDVAEFTEVTEATYTFNDLEENTEYIIYVRDNCGEYLSLWTASSSETTLYNCPATEEITISEITLTSAKVNWVTMGATSWKVIVQEASLDAPAEDSTEFESVDTTAEFDATNLEASTVYAVYIKEVCDGELGESLWSTPTYFSTECDVFTLTTENAYAYSFEDMEASCWDYINEGEGNDWEIQTNTADDSNYLRYRYHGDNAANAWAYTQEIHMTAGDVIQVKFDYKTESSFFKEKMKVTIGTEKTMASQSTILWDNNGGTDLSNTSYEEGTASYTVQETGTYYVAFNCYSDANKFYLYLEDIAISVTDQVILECAAPTNVMAADITMTSANISWTAGEADSWEIIVVPSSEDMPAEGTVVSETTYAATDLTLNTEYKVYVRDLCSADNKSDWTEAYTFTTLDVCEVSTNVMAANITATTADITWTTGGADSFEIIVVLATEEMPETGVVVTEAAYNAMELTPESTYNVYVRDICSELNMSEWTEVYSFTTAELGIEDNIIEGLKMYPNPIQDMLTISAKDNLTSVEVYNSLGQKVYTKALNSNVQKLDLSNLSQGSYAVKIATKSTVTTRRIVKK